MPTAPKLVAAVLFGFGGAALGVAVLAIVGLFIEENGYEELPDELGLYYLAFFVAIGGPLTLVGVRLLRISRSGLSASHSSRRIYTAAGLFAAAGAATSVGAFFLVERLSDLSAISETAALIGIVACALAIIIALPTGFRLLGRQSR